MKLCKTLLLPGVAALALTAVHLSAQPVVWEGYVNNVWDCSTVNWLAPGGVHVTGCSLMGGIKQLDDTAFNPAMTNINLTIDAEPAAVLVTNNVLSYTIGGTGSLSGLFGLIKAGSASLTLACTGINNFTGGVEVNGGTLVFATDNSITGGVTIHPGATAQVGTNGGTGLLPSGAVTNNGTLIFDRGANLTVTGIISGSGALSKIDAATLTLAGASTFTGTAVVTGGTLQAGNASAFGSSNASVVVANGGTLDINGFSLGTEPVTVSDAGAGGNGAIINSGQDQTKALRIVTLAGDATIGGNGGRWDIRASSNTGTDASLNMSPPGSGYNLTKAGSNYVALVGVIADPSLNNLTVQQGTLGVEEATSLGCCGTLTVTSGATLEFFSNSVPVAMMVELNGNGVTTTVLNNAGSPVISGPMMLNGGTGSVVFGSNGVDLDLDGPIIGSGSVLKIGSSQLTIGQAASAGYAGTTAISQGALVVDGFKTGGGITVDAGATLGGGGTIAEDVTVNGGVSPGNPLATAQAVLTVGGNVTLNGTTNLFELSTFPGGSSDRLTVNGNLSLTGTNTFELSPTANLNLGDVYTLVSYGGPGSTVDTSHIMVWSGLKAYGFTLIDPATTPGQIQIQVTGVPPTITSTAIKGTSVIINGTYKNTTAGTYLVLTSTNVSLALSKWTPVATNVLPGNGSFTLTATNAVFPNARQQFYLLQAQ